MQDKFRLDLNDEEAVQYLQSLIDESVSAMFPVVVEQIHKFAQVSSFVKIPKSIQPGNGHCCFGTEMLPIIIIIIIILL